MTEGVREVFKSLKEQPLSRVLDIVGMSPVSQVERVVLQGEDPLTLFDPSPAVSQFMRAGVPQIARRLEATKEFVDNLRKLGHGQIGEYLAKRYPRVAAHSKVGVADLPFEQYGATRLGTDLPEGSAVALNKKWLHDEHRIAETLAHEMTHVAQSLGLGKDKIVGLYAIADRWFGYGRNPFEVSARNVSDRVMNLRNSRPLNPLKYLLAEAMELPAGNHERAYVLRTLLPRVPDEMARPVYEMAQELPPGSPERIEVLQILMSRFR